MNENVINEGESEKIETPHESTIIETIPPNEPNQDSKHIPIIQRPLHPAEERFGIYVSVFLAFVALVLALSDQKQNQMLEKLTKMVLKYDTALYKMDTTILKIDSTNLQIDSTNRLIYDLVETSINQSIDFKNAFSPHLSIIKSGDFKDLGPDGSNDKMIMRSIDYMYYIRNDGAVTASNIYIKMDFLIDYRDTLRFVTSFENGKFENISLAPNGILAVNKYRPPFGIDPKIVSALSHAFVILKIRYYNPIKRRNEEFTEFYNHQVLNEKYFLDNALVDYIPKLQKYANQKMIF